MAVANYNAATADTDGDGFTDAAEIAAGTDQCDAASVIAAAQTGTTTTTTTEASTTTTTAVQEVPELALTGPSTALLGLLVALAMVVLGVASLAVGRRVDA